MPRWGMAVDLDRCELRHACQQPASQRPLSGTDFDDGIVRLGRNRIDDPRENARIVQEVLPEPLARPYLSSNRIST